MRVLSPISGITQIGGNRLVSIAAQFGPPPAGPTQALQPVQITRADS